MSLVTPTVFAFAGVYIGDYGVSVPMTSVRALRTRGARISSGYPTTYIPALGKYIRSGNLLTTCTLAFYSDDDTICRVAMGLSVTAPDINTEPGDQQYSLLLVAPDKTQASSWYFPLMQTKRVVELNYEKQNLTVLQITFAVEDREVVQHFWKKKSDDLIPIMGAITPI